MLFLRGWCTKRKWVLSSQDTEIESRVRAPFLSGLAVQPGGACYVASLLTRTAGHESLVGQRHYDKGQCSNGASRHKDLSLQCLIGLTLMGMTPTTSSKRADSPRTVMPAALSLM